MQYLEVSGAVRPI